jgi:hypothetical protein
MLLVCLFTRWMFFSSFFFSYNLFFYVKKKKHETKKEKWTFKRSINKTILLFFKRNSQSFNKKTTLLFVELCRKFVEKFVSICTALHVFVTKLKYIVAHATWIWKILSFLSFFFFYKKRKKFSKADCSAVACCVSKRFSIRYSFNEVFCCTSMRYKQRFFYFLFHFFFFKRKKKKIVACKAYIRAILMET